MFLSKIELSLGSPSVQQALRNAGDMHRNIQMFFGSARQDADVLYRVYETQRGACVYVQSSVCPEESEQTRRNGMNVCGCRDLSGMEAKIEDGNVFCFNLLAVPSRKVSAEGRKNSQRKLIRTPQEQLDWLSRKAAAGGFEVLSADCQKGATERIGRKNSRFVISGIRYQGYLRVTDVERFLECWRQGIGPEKAYGMGMLFIQ